MGRRSHLRIFQTGGCKSAALSQERVGRPARESPSGQKAEQGELGPSVLATTRGSNLFSLLLCNPETGLGFINTQRGWMGRWMVDDGWWMGVWVGMWMVGGWMGEWRHGWVDGYDQLSTEPHQPSAPTSLLASPSYSLLVPTCWGLLTTCYSMTVMAHTSLSSAL